MYKVFLNERKITISSPQDITDNVPQQKFEQNASSEDVKHWFKFFLNESTRNVILFHPQPSHFFNVFSEAFLTVPAAGGVVLSNEKILFILRNGKWDLPKGKSDTGETATETALREVEEECGITGHSIVKSLPATYHIYKSPHKKENYEWVLKETSWFEMTYSGIDSGTPETAEGITKIRWFTRNELNEVWENTYENLKQIITVYRG